MSGPILQAQNLCVRYGKVEAVREASLEIAPGAAVTVIGANGAGKSTLLNAIMGVLACAGSVSFDGRSFDDAEVEARVRAGVSLVPEKRELFHTMSVGDNLRLGAFGRPRAEGARTLVDVLKLFPRLEERFTQRAGTLSGGERQMLAIGRALMNRPRVLMLDEPSLGLAPRIVKEIFQILTDLRARGVSILLVEQNARAALQFADYAYLMELGEIKMQGKAADLAKDPRVVEGYLGLGGAH